MSITKIWFGKHKGTEFSKLPKSYLKWLYEQDFISPEVREIIEDVSQQYEITKEHKGWTGYINPITGAGGSRQNNRKFNYKRRY